MAKSKDFRGRGMDLKPTDVPNVGEVIYIIALHRREHRWWRRFARWVRRRFA